MNEPLLIGANPSDAVAFLKETGMGRTVLADADVITVTQVEAALEKALTDHTTATGVRLGSAAWLATARR